MLKETNHEYYCSDSNYFSNDAAAEFETVTDFLNEFEDVDIDLNLCFRFDIHKRNDDDDHVEDFGEFHVKVFLMLQRKGIFKPVYCKSYNPETESERLETYLKRHYEHLQGLWCEFSGFNLEG